MRKLILLLLTIIILNFLIVPVDAMDFTAPEAPSDVQKYMPDDTTSFSEGIWHVVKSTIASLRPDIVETAKVCVSLVAAVLLLSLCGQFSKLTENILNLLTAICVGLIVFKSTNSLIMIGTETIEQLSDYCKILLPTLTAASAANGAVTSSAALYTGTILFSTILTTLISKCIVPIVYIFMAICIASCAVPNNVLFGFKKFTKWLATWSIKTVLYIFTGYMSITGAINGSVDAAAIKAVKLTISGAVPVVGSVLSDASETILVSAGIMRNAVGIYGLMATIAICLGPFLKIGMHYLLLKFTAVICSIFANKSAGKLLDEMTGAMGLVLAMTGAVCLLLLISIVCLIRSCT